MPTAIATSATAATAAPSGIETPSIAAATAPEVRMDAGTSIVASLSAGTVCPAGMSAVATTICWASAVYLAVVDWEVATPKAPRPAPATATATRPPHTFDRLRTLASLAARPPAAGPAAMSFSELSFFRNIGFKRPFSLVRPHPRAAARAGLAALLSGLGAPTAAPRRLPPPPS